MLLFAVLLVVAHSANAQISYPEITVPTSYIDTVAATQNALYLNAQRWITSKSNKSSIELETEDKESGMVLARVESILPTKSEVNSYTIIKVQMNVKVDCRDNKYRVSFSDFTSTIQVDRSIDVRYMGVSSLEKMTTELEIVEEIARKIDTEKLYWTYDDIVNIKKQYINRNEDYAKEIAELESGPKKKKKDIKWRHEWIEENNQKIALLDYILNGFASVITETEKSLSNAMSIKDDF